MFWYILLGIIAVLIGLKFAQSVASPNYRRKFEGKCVVIIGASSGIGEELAVQVSKFKPKLVLAARRVNQLKEVEKRCIAAGAASVTVVPADVSKKENCREIIEKAVEENGTIDVLFLNAGIGLTATLFSIKEPEVLEKVFNVDFFGAMYPAFYALPHLRKSQGHIVVTSSVYGKLPVKGASAYCAAKHALHGFFDSLRMEESRNRIRVTLACPGYVSTPIHDNSLGGNGKQVGSHKKSSSSWAEIPLSKASRAILKATASNEKEIVIPLLVQVAVCLRGILGPSLFDRLAFGVK